MSVAAAIGRTALVQNSGAPAAMTRADAVDLLTVDFRYQPHDWRCLICMSADPVKTLVWKNGTMSNIERLSMSSVVAPGSGWIKQELVSPRVPIVVTHKRAGDLEIVEEAFVSPIAGDAKRVKAPFVQRIGGRATLRDWGSPTVDCEPAFRNAATGHREIVHYRFRAEEGHTYTVVFGFCEGANNQPGDRLMDIEVEAKLRRRLDLAAEFGSNHPTLIPMPVRDEDGDGLVDLAIAPVEGCKDYSSVLSVLWVFANEPKLDLHELLLGRNSASALAHVACGDDPDRQFVSPSVNVILVRLRNTGAAPIQTAPEFMVESPDPARPGKQDVEFGAWTATASEQLAEVSTDVKGAKLRFASQNLLPGQDRVVAVSVWRDAEQHEVPRSAGQAAALRHNAEGYWRELELPYQRVQVPDGGIQNVIEAGLRGIYQNRDYKNGVPVYQVGPTMYRDVSCADGSFFCELGAMLDRPKDASDTLDYFLTFQRASGRLWVYGDYWKENGLITWALVRYAQLTGDKSWLEKRWRHVEGMVAFIQELRRRSEQNPQALNYGLIPDGFGDGGAAGVCAEYSNVLWNYAGLRAAVSGASMLGKTEQAAQWQQEMDDMGGYLRRATQRDQRKDKWGNPYLPNAMNFDAKVPPPRGQWAFLQSIYPGQVQDPKDPLVLGTLAMLEAAEVEGLPLESGWLDNGVWPYFSNFQANALQWVGQGSKSAPLLYAIANHAAPVLNWWEEQMLQSKGERVSGDMPHHWGSVEFIRQVRFMLALERGSELHLFEGLPSAWVRPGMITRLEGVLTEFGPLSCALRVSADGRKAVLTVEPPSRVPPSRVVLHLDGWSGAVGAVDLPNHGRVEYHVEMNPNNTWLKEIELEQPA
jgi:hypothetical protein